MADPDQVIRLDMTVSEIEKAMTALGKLPYVEVAQLITKIQGQAGPQVAQPSITPPTVGPPPAAAPGPASVPDEP